MEINFGKLIGGIVAFSIGGITTIYWKVIRDFMLALHKATWGNLLKRPVNITKMNYYFATITIRIMGLMLLFSGICLLYQFFTGKNWTW